MSHDATGHFGVDAHVVADNLVKIYKVADLEVVALQGLDLTVDHGEFVAVVGASGSGKSTLGRCAVRLLPVTAGQVRVNGRDIAGLSRRRLRPLRRDFNIVFQDPASSLSGAFAPHLVRAPAPHELSGSPIETGSQ